jgi:hypothetical protein
MGPPSYMRSVVERNIFMRHIPVFKYEYLTAPEFTASIHVLGLSDMLSTATATLMT